MGHHASEGVGRESTTLTTKLIEQAIRKRGDDRGSSMTLKQVKLRSRSGGYDCAELALPRASSSPPARQAAPSEPNFDMDGPVKRR